MNPLDVATVLPVLLPRRLFPGHATASPGISSGVPPSGPRSVRAGQRPIGVPHWSAQATTAFSSAARPAMAEHSAASQPSALSWSRAVRAALGPLRGEFVPAQSLAHSPLGHRHPQPPSGPDPPPAAGSTTDRPATGPRACSRPTPEHRRPLLVRDELRPAAAAGTLDSKSLPAPRLVLTPPHTHQPLTHPEHPGDLSTGPHLPQLQCTRRGS